MGVHLELASIFQAGKSVGVHSFLPQLNYNGAAKSVGYTLSRPYKFKADSKECTGVYLSYFFVSRNPPPWQSDSV